MILEAYHLTAYQLSDGSGWTDSDLFEIDAKAETADTNRLRQMLQTLLAERCKLAVHRGTREMPVYALTVAKNGPKFKKWKEGDPLPPFDSGGHPQAFRDVGTMQHLADTLSDDELGRPVIDKTGLGGFYLFYVGFDTQQDFLLDLQDQLGLKVESQKTSVEVTIIDHVEKPTAN